MEQKSKVFCREAVWEYRLCRKDATQHDFAFPNEKKAMLAT